MQVYQLTPQGNIKLKKLWLLTVLCYLITAIGIFAFNLLYKGGTTPDVVMFSVLAAAMIVAFYFGRKKYIPVVDSTRLTVYDDKVTYHVCNKPDITIAYANVRQIDRRKHGIFLVNKNPSKQSLLIHDNFENDDEIVNYITERVAQYDKAAIA